MKQLYFVVFLFITSFSIAQTDSTKVKNDSLITVLTDPTTTENFLKNTSIASPTAAALGKYADVPINYNTGLPSIMIPLATVKGSQLSLPISLSYHGGGHKVADIASWVGLGWSLNAGGIITRQVMGGPDESWNGDKGTLPSTQGQAGITTQTGFYNDFGFSLPQYVFNSPNTQEGFEKWYKFLCAGVGLLDTEPDVFSFNIGGIAGKFYFDASRKAHFIPQQDFKVEVIYLGNPTYEFETFILTAPDGTRYYFGGSAYEKSGSVSGNGFGGSYLKSAWYLYKIESADRLDSITLSYVNEGQSFLNLNEAYYEQTTTGATQHVISGNQHLVSAFYSRTQVEGKRLAEINSSQMKVVFSANTLREDVAATFSQRGDLSRSFDTPKRLDEISIESVANSNEKIKFKFSYDYLQSVAPPVGTPEYDLWTLNLSDNSDKKRLRLVSIQEMSGDETLTKPPYLFSYEGTPLPRRLSFGRDHWGYSNGQYDNKSLIDDSYINPKPNKSSLWSAMQASHLTQITYPTGGSVQYTFEPHYTDASKTNYVGGLRILKVKEIFASGNFIEKTFDYGNYLVGINETMYRYTVPSSFQTWRDFVDSNWSAASPLPFYSGSCPLEDANGRPSSSSILRAYNSSLYGPLKSFLSSSPSYQNVTVSRAGSGYTTYYYSDITPFSAGLTFPFSSGNMINYVNNGKITREEYYNDLNQLQKRTDYAYNSLPDYSVPSTVTAYKWYPFSACSQYMSFAVSKYSYLPTRSLLIRRTETTYNLSGTNSVSKTTHYDYGTNHQQPIREAFLASNGDSLITRSVYVHDYNLPPLTTTSYVPDPDISELQVGTCRQMQTANQNELVERVNYIKKIGSTTELAIGGRFFGYSWYAFAGKKGAVSTLFLSQPKNHTLSYYNPAAYEIYHDKLTYELRSISSYNLGSGLLAYEKQTKNSSSGSDGPLNYCTWYPNGLLDSKVVYSPTRFSLGLGIYYNHSSLFGVISISTSNLTTTYFDFDKLGRLSQIKDNQSMIENQFSYYYGASNYVKTQSPRINGYTLPSNTNDLITTHQYVDGLGRTTQTIDKNGSPVSGLDIVTQTQTYDNVGRPLKKYLPFALANWGHEVTPPTLIQGDAAGFSEVSLYDNSPLNRPLQHFGAGKAWRDANKFTAVAYGVNDGSIRLYRVDNQGAVTSSLYAAGVLYKTTKTDEAGHQSIDYTDKEGRLIQRLVQDGESSYQTTAYIYDDLGRLRYVVQPEGFANAASFTTNSSVFTDYIFGYRYDGRGRVIAKHVPNGGWTRTVYDVIDRPVLEQTPLQALENKWTFHKYDGLGREIMQGEKVLNDSHEVLQQTVYDWTYVFEDLGTDIKGYTNRTLPITEADVQTVFYYGTNAYPVAMPTHVFGQQAHYSAKGILVEQQHRNGNVFDTYRSYYNSRNQLIYDTYEHTGTPAFSLKSSYDPAFQGEMKRIQRIFERGGSRDTLRGAWTYDHRARPLTYAESINSPVLKLIANYQYDSIGRLQQKKFLPNGTYLYSGIPDYINRPPNPNVGIDDVAKKAICLLPGTQLTTTYSATINPQGTAPISGLQTIDYAYHIRGGLRGINLDGAGNAVPNSGEGDLFSYKLNYETGTSAAAGQWDGNIGKQTWKNDTESQRSYLYTYDPAKRLKSATYTGVETENYSLQGLNYDKNGNIKNLQRFGKTAATTYGLIDNLTYTRNGNRLQSLTDASGSPEGFKESPWGGGFSFVYYPDGSLRGDANELIQNIVYDTFWKQPTEVQLFDGRKIKNYYDGGGTLLKTIYYSVTNTVLETWEFLPHGMVYKNGLPYQLTTPEGRAVWNGTSWTYEFDYKDHLGNTRVSFKEASGVLVKTAETAFDPYGVRLNGIGSVNSFQNRYEMQGHEKEATFGLNRINFGARTLNPTTGIWDRIDPMSEKYYGFSPYNYTLNNPINAIDPDGNAIEHLQNGTRYTGDDAVNAFINLQNGGGGGKQSSTGGGGCGSSGQPPCPDKKTGDMATDIKSSLEYGWNVATWTLKETLKEIDQTQFLGGGNELLEGNYLKGAALLMISTGKIPGGKTIAKNAKKMLPDDIGVFLKAGEDWHKGSAKKDFLKQFKKELKGDTNADFYFDKDTRDVFLKSNKSGNWINTGQKFNK